MRIASNAGYSKKIGVALALPVVNLFALFWFAYAKWPVREQLAETRRELAQVVEQAGGRVTRAGPASW